MDLLAILATLSGMHMLMAMLPGPNTVVVSHFAAAQSRQAGLVTAGGVVTASLLWVGLSLMGIGLVMQEAGTLYRILRLLGVAYLVYVAIRLLLAARLPRPGLAEVAAPKLGWIGRNPFRAGLLTTLSNPKSAVFWTSLFAVAIPAQAPGWFCGAVVAIIAVQSALWYGLIALVLSTGPARRSYAILSRWLDGLAGIVMLALGLKLADELRREIMLRTAG